VDDRWKYGRRDFLRMVVFSSAAGSLAPIIASCSPGPSSGGTKQGDVLRIAMGTEPGSLDPIHQISDVGGAIQWEVTQPLTSYFTADAKLSPQLAESWTVSPDAKQFTFTLRKDVKFTDGTPFNAQAVKVNFDRILDKNHKISNLLDVGLVDTVTVVDDYHVQFTLKQPISFFPYSVAYYVEALVSPDSLTKLGNSYDDVIHPVGTGPYKFVEYAKASHVTLERNEDYWGKKPAWRKLQFSIVPEAASREAMVLSGDADIALSPPPADVEKLRQQSGLSVVTQAGNRAIFIGINTTGTRQPLLRDVRVRQAINYAVDKQTIISKVLFGLGDAADSPAPKVLSGYKRTGNYAYDPNKAKQLLQAAGATGMTLKMGSPTGRYLQDFQAATAVAGYLKDVGIIVDGPQTMDFPTYAASVFVPPAKAKFDLSFLGFQSTSTGGCMEFFTTQFIPPGGLNFAGYSNPQVDSLVSKADGTSNQDEANKSFGAAQQLIWDDAPWLFLWTEKATVLVAKKVQGVKVMPQATAFVDDSSPA
jgi:peptide/nickel transport system substrate-binding protein